MEKPVIEALAKVPELVETTKTIIEQNEKINAIFGKALEQRAQAIIPSEEIQKVVHAVTEEVKHTRCAAPDAGESSELIAKGVLKSTLGAVENAVRDAIKNTPITLEHHHIHATTYEMAKLADEWSKRWLSILGALCCLLLFVVAGGLVWFYQSEYYWGREYSKVHESQYATPEEKELLWKNARAIVVFPLEFTSNPEYAKAKIKQNKQVLKERQKQAKENGKYDTRISLER